MSREIKDLTDNVIKEHRPVETHWHGEGPYHCICGAEINAVSEDALRWIFQFHCVSEAIAYAQKEVLYDVLAFNSGLGCTPQEGYRDLNHALDDTKHLSSELATKRVGAEVLAAVANFLEQTKRDELRLGNVEAANVLDSVIFGLRALQPAAKDLEELLEEARREERLCVLAENPGLCNGDEGNPQRHARCCKYHQEISELEKARASLEKL